MVIVLQVNQQAQLECERTGFSSVQDIAPLLKLKDEVRLYYEHELKATRLGLKRQV